MKEIAERLVGLAGDMDAKNGILSQNIAEYRKLVDECKEEKKSQAGKRKELVAREKAVKYIEDVDAQIKVNNETKTALGDLKSEAVAEMDKIRELTKSKSADRAERETVLVRREKGLDSKEARLLKAEAKL